MKRIQIDNLKGNEILAKAVMTDEYQVLLGENTVVRKEYVERLRELGITEVFVKEPEKQLIEEVVILKHDMEDGLKEKVKTILERHTYSHNEELVELTQTADNIIEQITEENDVIEQVFDIKQRSADIYEHSVNISSLAILTALKVGIEKEHVHDIGVACLLHDIGLRYLTIKWENKDTSEFSEMELAEYKKHPVYGYSALKDEDWITNACKNMILYHHERMDGSGYPLKATSLAEEIKIINVCDSFDEMICGIGCRQTKVYEAIEYLKNFKNVKFDGKIVDAFLDFTAVYPAGTTIETNEGEIAIVVRQNKQFPDRPVIRVIQDKNGNPVVGVIMKDLITATTVFIERAID